jgi:hypothetical protein
MSTVWEIDPDVAVTLSVKLPVDALGPALTDNGEVAVLPDDGVIGVGSAKLTSDGAVPTQDGVNVTAELKPLSEPTVIVAEALPSWVTETADDDDEIEKSGPATLVLLLVLVVVVSAVICTVKSGPTLWLSEPLVPVTRSVNVPTEALGSAVIANGELAELPDGGVTAGIAARLTPDGAVPTQDAVNDTGELNPPSEPTVIVTEPLPP